jgi:hypothetical protein
MVPTDDAMITRQMPYSAGAPSRAMVPLAILFPLNFLASLEFLLWVNAGRHNPPKRGPSEKMPQAAIFSEMGENRAGPHQTGQESSRSYMEPRSKSSEGFWAESAPEAVM